jgi:DNA-directed RNA polymerase sigma subunit (sigma70/sigma32)
MTEKKGMDASKVRQELYNYFANKEIIKNMAWQLDEYRKMDNLKANVITDMPTGTSNSSYIIENRIEYIRLMQIDYDEMMRIDRCIESVISLLRGNWQTIIEMRYFITPIINDVRQRHYTWAEIANEIKYNEDYCREIDRRIIQKIQNKIHQVL